MSQRTLDFGCGREHIRKPRLVGQLALSWVITCFAATCSRGSGNAAGLRLHINSILVKLGVFCSLPRYGRFTVPLRSRSIKPLQLASTLLCHLKACSACLGDTCSHAWDWCFAFCACGAAVEWQLKASRQPHRKPMRRPARPLHLQRLTPALPNPLHQQIKLAMREQARHTKLVRYPPPPRQLGHVQYEYTPRQWKRTLSAVAPDSDAYGSY
jgi:hypothetical protein